MAGPKQSKRVSWAPDANLCKVRLFLSEDAPTQCGLVGNQDHLQAKASLILHSTSSASDDSLPPGFEALNNSQIQTNIPLIKWQSPPNQWLKPEWLVVAGEESLESSLQNRRQLGVLEAVYPRLSSIPPDPCIFPDVQLAHIDDSRTLLIPIIAIEDEDAVEPETTLSQTASTMLPIQNPPTHQPPSTSVKPDIAAAASAAFTAIMLSNQQGSLIDRDLLIKILSDPGMVEKLASEHSASKQTSSPSLANLPPQLAPEHSTSISLNMPTALPNPPPAKDMHYYKSLIQKHGGDRQESSELVSPPYEKRHNGSLGFEYREEAGRETRYTENRKSKKPCVYFNTSRGCRQGDGCYYLHDSSPSKKIERQRGSKRVKFDR